ncbi:cyanophycinase [Phycisphaera mikurensis]|uniref:Cyanophycinase n=1 Tax=Phycisphaera mikurensis (strain NBRC 102666 / KCTC 22515 / FYK2301M01) TaxID=1142394 RepID=I0IES7_PHYMF|nr:cyanophycinase [Phycisphaera mikurensis]MBB6441560.1 cyanophycinase [Phycisphaera mikurensis]BAM03765.1 cyanophycinase [Phycisphaera mikurensis NBRC 102666]
MTRSLLTLSLFLSLACGAAAQGTLVIVGGGLKPENEAVYRAVLDRMPADGRLGVLPTASGVPEESGPLTVQDFEQYAGPEQRIELIDLRNGEVDKANDPAWAARIKACDALWFTGGDQARIVSTFRVEPVGDANPELEDGPDSLAYAAVKGVLEKRGVVAGTSAGAAMMSDPMILWGNSHEALLVGVVNDVPDFGVGLGRGMGLLPGVIVDQHFFERKRLGRLLVAGATSGERMLFGIAENTALVLDFQSPDSVEVVGEGQVMVAEITQIHAYADGRKRPGAFLLTCIPSGLTLRDGKEPPDAMRRPDAEEVNDWMSGAPRAYEGPPAFRVEPEPTTQRSGWGGFRIVPQDEARTAFTEASEQLEAARE